MDLSQIKADLRIRSAWEAVDLGFAMVRTWAKTIYLPWVIFLLTFVVILWEILPDDSHWMASLILWWFKPVYDRLLLYIISQQLFSMPVGAWQSLKKLPSLMKGNGLISGLTYRRLSASRGFNLPIWQLEGLKGATRKKRQNLLHTRAHSQAVWLTIACVHIEVILYLAFFGFVLLWLPDDIQENFFRQFFLEQDAESKNYWIGLTSFSFYTLSVIAIEPFYVAGSFGLYLNRRTQLEAWDLELVFRNMAERLNTLKAGIKSGQLASILFAVLISMVTLGASFGSQAVMADDEPVSAKVLPPEKSKQVIEELMQTEKLKHTKKISFWRLKDNDWDIDEEPDLTALEKFILMVGKLFAVIFKSALWILLIVVVILLIVYRDRWLPLFQSGEKTEEKKEKPDVLFGMDIRPDSLPDDIPAAAKQFWQQGKQREALSLLYRGALMRLVNEDNVPLEDSHTEGDVMRLSRKVLAKQREQYLEKLTQVWRRAAYAHQFPDDSEAQSLFDHWKQDFTVSEGKA